MMLGVDLAQLSESLKELPDKTDEMLDHLRTIERLLAEISEHIQKLGSE